MIRRCEDRFVELGAGGGDPVIKQVLAK